MKFSTVDRATLHFPREEWQWLRASVEIQGPEKSPDEFFWAARIGEQLWAWHPRGGCVSDAGASKVRVLELETDGSELEAHALFLKTTFAAEPGQDVEWVAALQVLEGRLAYKLAERGLPKYWPEALGSCGLEAHLGVLAQRGRFRFLTRDEMQLICERRWDLSALELLETTPAAVRTAFVAAIRKWNLTAGGSKEALSAAMLLFRKMGEKSALHVIGSTYANGEEFRTALFRTSQPELATLSQKRIEMLRDLGIPPRTSVFGDPSFESDMLKITHTPRKMIDFERFKFWMAEPETTEKIRRLLEIYQ